METRFGIASILVFLFLALSAGGVLADHPGYTQGASPSNPDGNGADKPYPADGQPAYSQGESDWDGNNGCGNDDDFEDDNNGLCGGPNRSGGELPGGGVTPPPGGDVTPPGGGVGGETPPPGGGNGGGVVIDTPAQGEIDTEEEVISLVTTAPASVAEVVGVQSFTQPAVIEAQPEPFSAVLGVSSFTPPTTGDGGLKAGSDSKPLSHLIVTGLALALLTMVTYRHVARR